ncbi:MAG TPA: DUF3052 domain-containing protein [Candidatus Angelobacter sp.]|nr:DUF3052 domain-containing protein [Candidatus Angelobacter sp.]
MAGYSGTPLIQKIGIKPGYKVVLRNHPASFVKDLGKLPQGAEKSERLSRNANVVVYFTDRRADLEKDFEGLASSLASDGMLWIGWPKKASGRPTDLTEDVVRNIGLERGLVDVKVCAIDETWSGLKFVIRLKDRPALEKEKADARRAKK